MKKATALPMEVVIILIIVLIALVVIVGFSTGMFDTLFGSLGQTGDHATGLLNSSGL